MRIDLAARRLSWQRSTVINHFVCLEFGLSDDDRDSGSARLWFAPALPTERSTRPARFFSVWFGWGCLIRDRAWDV